MCTVSMVGDAYAKRWVPDTGTYPIVYPPQVQGTTYVLNSPVTRAEFDKLKAEVEEMKELLRAAKRIDEITNQPDCENADKLAVLRKVAELVGVDLTDVIGAS